jgi:hypothetical protein
MWWPLTTISQMVILSVGGRVVAFAIAGLLFSRALGIAVMFLLPADADRSAP